MTIKATAPALLDTLANPTDLPKHRQLRIYTDFAGAHFHRPSYLILPFLPTQHESCPLLNTFASAQPNFCTTTLADSDVAVLPFDADCLLKHPYLAPPHEARAFALEFVRRARTAGKLTLAVATGDRTVPLGVNFDIVLRHSIDRRRQPQFEYCLPAWLHNAQNADPGLEIQPRQKQTRPIVGFCGQAAPPGKHAWRRAREFARSFTLGPGSGHDRVDSLVLRSRVLEHLSHSELVRCSFLVRDKYYFFMADQENARRDYLRNMEVSDYVLCVRGHGNYSFRLFDALSMGRVPVLVDTDCALPFDFLIDYRSLFPIVSLDRIAHLPQIISEHYGRHSDEGWRDLQHTMRKLYVDWLSPVGFFSHLTLIPPLAVLVND